jgi:hypothetical protein
MRETKQYFSYRLKLEKLKQKTWQLVIFARLMLFLVILASYYWR